MLKHKVLLSTDIGSDIDDALALLVMLNHPAFDINGIYTVNGNVDARSYIAHHMIKLSGKHIPVARGESQALDSRIRPYYFFEDCLVDDSYINHEESSCSPEIAFKRVEDVGILSNGVDDLVARLKKEKCSVISIAPATNIAKALEQSADAATNIERIYIMGCRFSEADAREHNVRYDLAAMARVLESKTPITIIPGNVCEQYRMPTSMLERLKSPAGQYVRKMARGFLAAKTAQAFGTSIIEGLNLKTILEELVLHKSPAGLDAMNENERLEWVKRSELVTNLDDPYFGALDQEGYFRQYQKLIDHINDPRLQCSFASILTHKLESLTPKTLSVSDVYVPYCIAHPEKVKTKKMKVICNLEGKSLGLPNGNHEVVQDLDFDDFKEFLKIYLK